MNIKLPILRLPARTQPCRLGKQTLSAFAFAIFLAVPGRANPYADYLNQWLNSGPPLPAMPTGSGLTSAWSFPAVSIDMQKRVWGATSSLCTLDTTQKATLVTQIKSELNYLFSQETTGGRWWSESSTIVGDSNIDRFVLSDVMDTLCKLRNDSRFSGEISGWLSSARLAVTFQFDQYGKKSNYDWATKMAGRYPNMDAAYTLIMGAAGVVYANSAYTSSGQAFAIDLRDIVQPDGTLPYMETTGASLGYTDIVVNWLSRYLAITGDLNAKTALQKMTNYYPKQLLSPGLSENATAPWWKHANGPLSGSPGAIDVIAALAPSGANAYYAQELLKAGYMDPDDAVVGATYWVDMGVSVPRDNVVATDVDMHGFRGRFDKWGWTGILNPGVDTFVGATLSTSNLAVKESRSGLSGR